MDYNSNLEENVVICAKFGPVSAWEFQTYIVLKCSFLHRRKKCDLHNQWHSFEMANWIKLLITMFSISLDRVKRIWYL